VTAIAARDQGALATLYDRHSVVAYALACRLLGERGAAEGAMEDAFLALWRTPLTFAGPHGNVRARLLAHICRGAHRHKRTAGTPTPPANTFARRPTGW
jgi:DNA-directed RNA polymerase specialized sigma24 family protein